MTETCDPLVFMLLFLQSNFVEENGSTTSRRKEESLLAGTPPLDDQDVWRKSFPWRHLLVYACLQWRY